MWEKKYNAISNNFEDKTGNNDIIYQIGQSTDPVYKQYFLIVSSL